ncbi:ATP-dependent DNA helicase recG-like protein [Bisgaardia hudsonensis]|uniref:ATP-dependent DNA helicase recG-like protein n=1 Tax=Bisgaardia hudsonensis TaxID=109472 RepID=A0A4V2SJD6_9PAST|nr:ATP-binding protein [Bisgaardia hudsonensis]QLB12749.1 hypothetical protein A6A11_03570 [Bisgaardia hudsonensis]TCP14300.1 ATP-dependent DNA helicase recG-like protein [Bisgaardia hudsonensis]
MTRTEENQITQALREALVNTLTHADYFNDINHIVITKTENKLKFENPGVMLVKIEEAINGTKSVCRNSSLHNIFRKIGLCERQGKGVERIFKNWKKDLLTDPVLNSIDTTTSLELTLQDGKTIDAIRMMTNEFGDNYSNLKILHKNILILTAINDGWCNHTVLSENLKGNYTGRDITLALPYLEKRGFLVGKVEKRNKYYLLSLQANLQAKSHENHNELQLDLFDINLNNKSKLTQHCENINHEENLKSLVPHHFFISRKKKPQILKELVLKICDKQFVSKKVLEKVLGISEPALGSHLRVLVKDGLLELAYPQQPTHQDQAYRSKDTV